MRFSPLRLPGAYLIELDPIVDERGFFARSFDADEFRARGLEPEVAQTNVSFTAREGTLRGLHYQREPHGEAKLIRCVRGEIFDVAVDLRRGSPTFKESASVTLAAGDNRMVFLAKGLAHGFLTLSDACEVTYQMSHPYVAASATGVRWNDPAFAIPWPARVKLVSERDASFPDFTV